MAAINIGYHKHNKNIGQCQIILPKESVDELLLHLNPLLEIEFYQGKTKVQHLTTTTITFQANRVRIQILERVITY